MVWMGMFFSPGLPAINLIKLAIMMYLRSWAVLTCNVPHEVVFRASRSNNFYLALLLMMLFLCVLPVGFAIVSIEPSWHCGPFSDYERIYHFFTETLHKALPKKLHKSFDYIASPGIIIPLLMLLVLIIYYLVSLTNALREANNDLKIQLRRERTEERRKMFQLVTKRARKGSKDSETPFAKWKKLLPELATKQMNLANDTEKENKSETEEVPTIKKEISRKELLGQLIRKALKKSSGTSNPEVKEEEVKKEDIKFEKKEYQAQEKTQTQNADKNENISEAQPNLKESYKLKKLQENSGAPQKNYLPDNIPEIRIIKTESDEQLLQNDKKPSVSGGGKVRLRVLIEKYIKIRRTEKEALGRELDKTKVETTKEQKELRISVFPKEEKSENDEEKKENKCPLAKEEDISNDLD